MKLSVNYKIINKNQNEVNQAYGFESVDVSVEQLAEFVNEGFCFSYQFEKQHRKTDNFICTDIIAADVDEGMTLEEAMANAFISQEAAFIYTTASHTEEDHRFRIVFQLPYTITDKELLRKAQTGLARKFPADGSSSNASRQFYGCLDSQPHIIGKILSVESLKELFELGTPTYNLTDTVSQKSRTVTSRSDVARLNSDSLVKDAKGIERSLSTVPKSTSIFCPIHWDKNPSAFVTESKTGIKGVHCSSCKQTFWVKNDELLNYDFFEFDKIVRGLQEEFTPSYLTQENDEIEVLDSNQRNVILEDKFLNDLTIFSGITLVKSPKGTGKTQYLKRVVNECKSKRQTILLVGHRQSLLKALSKELGLECYLSDTKESAGKIRKTKKKYFAISVDSISTHLNTKTDRFDVVLIDESEQVFSHLISETMDYTKRNSSYKVLKFYIHSAKNCIALDADLNTVTMTAINKFNNKNPFIDTYRVLNTYKPPSSQIEIYSRTNHLIGQIFKDLNEGKKLYICSNSKKRVDELTSAILEEFGCGFPLYKLTKDNSASAESAKFIKNIKTEILKYRVVLASPVLGTGVDITFPDEEKLVDGVYGIFEARINTHTDIDQQLSRVRHPGFTRIWISPEKFNFETEFDPIRLELAESNVIPEVFLKHSRKGEPEYDLEHPYLNIYATILSAQRASKNNLKQNFIDLKNYNGWDVLEIEIDNDLTLVGSLHQQIGSDVEKEKRIKGILDSRSAHPEEINKLKDLGQHNISQSERFLLERYFIEHFYYQPISRDLINLDDNSKYQTQIKRLEELISVTDKRSIFLSKECNLLKTIFLAADILDYKGIPDTAKKITVESLGQFIKFCHSNKSKINRILKIDIRKDILKSPVQQLNVFLNLCGLSASKVSQYDFNTTRIYVYAVNEPLLSQALNVIDIRQKHNL